MGLSHLFSAETANPWFALQVWAGRERRSAEHLQMRGYDVFLPCYRERRQWSDRLKTIERALFAGYLFCRFQRGAVASLVTTPGVIGIVGDGHHALPVPDEEIEAVQRIVASQLQAEPCATFRAGQRVRVSIGPLAGTEGVVVRQQNQHRLIVSIELLQRAVAVELDPDWVNIPLTAMS